MSLFVVDVESDGPIIGHHSMVCFGVVKLDDSLSETFYGKTAPISDKYIESALSVSGFSRSEHLDFAPPEITMNNFLDWVIKTNVSGKPTLISDNNGYDASWINYYFHVYCNTNPFGWTSRRIGDLFCGAEHDLHYKWKWHRDSSKYPHNHNPLSDALGNATALLYFFEKYKIKIPK